MTINTGDTAAGEQWLKIQMSPDITDGVVLGITWRAVSLERADGRRYETCAASTRIEVKDEDGCTWIRDTQANRLGLANLLDTLRRLRGEIAQQLTPDNANSFLGQLGHDKRTRHFVDE